MRDQAAVGFVESHRTVSEYPTVGAAQIGITRGVENHVVIRLAGLLDSVLVFISRHLPVVFMGFLGVFGKCLKSLFVAICDHFSCIPGISVVGGKTPPVILDDMTELSVQHVEEFLADLIRRFSLAGSRKLNHGGEMGKRRRIGVMEFFGGQVPVGARLMACYQDQSRQRCEKQTVFFHDGQVVDSVRDSKIQKIR